VTDALGQVTSEAQLLLALLSTRPARDRVRPYVAELGERMRLERFEQLLGHNGLEVLAPVRLREAGLDDVAATVERDLAPRIAARRSSATVLEVMTRSVLERLEAAGIPSVALKGALMSRRIYDDPAARRSSDIDLLVPEESLADAVRVIREAFGYTAPRDAVDRQGRPVLHFELRHPGGWPNVEVHWRTHWYEERSGGVMIRRSTIVDGVRCLAPADECATLLLYYARDGFLGLRTIGMVAGWWDRFGDLIGPEGLMPFAEEFPALRPGLVAAATLGEALLGLPAAELALPPVRGRGELRAIRLADVESCRPRPELEAQTYAVDLMLTPARRLGGVIRRQKLINDTFADSWGLGREAGGRRATVSLLPLVLRRAARIFVAARRTGPLGTSVGAAAGRSIDRPWRRRVPGRRR
jgi:hypothetical protein